MECVDHNENQDLDNRRFCVSAFGRLVAVGPVLKSPVISKRVLKKNEKKND